MSGDAFRTQLLDMIGATDYAATFADPSRELVDVEPYGYVIDGNTLPANITATAPQTFDLPMQGDSDFVLMQMSQFARVAAATVLTVNPSILVQIIDLSTGRSFFAGPSPVCMVAGQGGFPFILPGPRLIKARAVLRTTALAASNINFSGFYMVFHGARLWYR